MTRPGRALLAALFAMTLVAAGRGEQGVQGVVRYVTDGDTFRLTSGERIRIAGIDAPETHAGQAKCRAELRRGQESAAQARALLAHRTITFQRVGRSYNRTVAEVRVDGRDLATMLVEAGAARWWPRGQAKPDWCGGARR
nr:thermonuclease family protein [uncultured Sphingomonas sp.]